MCITIQRLIHSIGGQVCFLAELSSDEQMAPDLDGTQHCSHCNTSLNLPNTRSLIIHSSAHILNDRTIGDDDELCGLCLQPSTHCLFRVICRSGDPYQLDLLHSTCTHIVKSLSKQTFNYLISAKPTVKSPCTNIPVQCPLCNPDQLFIWRYNMAIHLCHTHPQNAERLIPEFTISDREKTLMKAKWDGIQKALNSSRRFKNPKAKKPSMFTV